MGRGKNQPASVSGTMSLSLRGAEDPAKPMRVDIYEPHKKQQGEAVAGQLQDYEGLLVEFPRDLSEWEQEQVRGSVCYWGYLPFTSNQTTENEWLSPRHFWLDASSYRSRSSNWRDRDVFSLLEEFVTEGTPIRKRQNNTRAWAGIGTGPSRIILNHPGDTPPPVDQPLDFTRKGRQMPPRIKSAQNLLSFS